MEARGKQVIRGRMRSYCGLIFSLFLLPLQISLSLIITTEGCLQTGRLLVICLLSETKHVPTFSRKRPPRSVSFFSKPFSFLFLSFFFWPLLLLGQSYEISAYSSRRWRSRAHPLLRVPFIRNRGAERSGTGRTLERSMHRVQDRIQDQATQGQYNVYQENIMDK